MYLAPR